MEKIRDRVWNPCKLRELGTSGALESFSHRHPTSCATLTIMFRFPHVSLTAMSYRLAINCHSIFNSAELDTRSSSAWQNAYSVISAAFFDCTCSPLYPTGIPLSPNANCRTSIAHPEQYCSTQRFPLSNSHVEPDPTSHRAAML